MTIYGRHLLYTVTEVVGPVSANGPHSINGQGTFTFLRKHLNWPEPQ